jgi:hypothetical protein
MLSLLSVGAAPPPIRGASDNWIAYLDKDGKRHVKPVHRHPNIRPRDHEELPPGSIWGYGGDKYQAELQLEQNIAQRKHAAAR